MSTPSSSASGNIIPAVDDDDVIPVAERHHVHPELAQTAERDYLQFLI